MIEEISEFKSNIVCWYPFENGSKIGIIGSCKELEDYLIKKSYNVTSYSKEESYNYVICYGENNLVDLNSLNLLEDGKLILIVNNRFGLMNWNNGNDLKEGISQNEIGKFLENSSFKYIKYYYCFPNYENANLIFSDDYKVTLEDITRNFPIYDKDKIVCLDENDVYGKIYKYISNDGVKKFANSFFVEISKSQIKTKVNYVSFTNYRKEEYRIATLLDSKHSEKIAMNDLAKKHISEISENIEKIKENYPEYKFVEKFENGKILGDFIKLKRFDDYLFDLDSKENFKAQIEKFYTPILNKSIKFDEFVKDINYRDSENFLACIKFEDYDLLKNLHFLDTAYVDLIPKNVFIDEEKMEYFVIDQEWKMENIPYEYILYRAILNTRACYEKYNVQEIIQLFGLSEYVNMFNKIDMYFSENIMDSKMHELIFRDYVRYSELDKILSNFKNNIKELNEKIDRLIVEKDNIEKINKDLENQLAIVNRSFSWKILKPFRLLYWMLNPFNGASFIDRIMPPGGKRRNEYEVKKSQKRYENKVKKYFELTDDKTAEYWKGIDHRKFIKYQKDIENSQKGKLNEYEKIVLEGEILDKQIELQENTKFKYRPKISIVIPLYNTNLDYFRELLYTIHSQTYSNWELCLADGSEEKLENIRKMCEKDKRIKYKFIGRNKGISENTNEALKMCTGDFIALVDHDDLLSVDALFEVVKAINENRNVKFIYTDEDKIHFIDESRFEPSFKPDFSINTLRSVNYICHLSVFRKDLMNELVGFKSEYDGAQDYDIILRMSEICNNNEIKHINKVLYHWRVHPNSTAVNFESKLYAYEAGRKAITDHLNRLNLKADVKINTNSYGSYKVYYKSSEEAVVIEKKNNESLSDVIRIIQPETKYAVIVNENVKQESDDWYNVLLGQISIPNSGIVSLSEVREFSNDFDMIERFEKNECAQDVKKVKFDCIALNCDLCSELINCSDDEICEKIIQKGRTVVLNPLAKYTKK